MKSTLITHFYNESFILPYFLKWHLNLFDHGVLIDYNSNDDSADICRTLAPHWDYIKSEYQFFTAGTNDQEVMKYEAAHSGIKMVLNTTEFLFGIDPFSGLKDNKALRTRSAIMVTPFSKLGNSLDPSVSLPEQCYEGFFEREPPTINYCHERIIHTASTGRYGPGRHTSQLDQEQSFDVFTLHYAWAPFNEEFIKRKLQIQEKIENPDLIKSTRGPGYHHIIDRKQLLSQYSQYYPYSRDLRERDERFESTWNHYFKTDD
jgi:hypothetical protein